MGKYKPILRIAELGNLTHAADTLGYSQSSLSYITSSIEKELGLKLFHRERQGVTLTKAGAELIEIMRQIEQLEDQLHAAALSHRTEVLRVGTLTSMSTVWLPDLLIEFYQKYPDTKVHIIQKERYSDLFMALQKRTLDCTFFVGKHSPAYDFSPLYDDNYYVVIAKTHPLTQNQTITPEDLFPLTFLPPSESTAPSPLFDLYEQLKASCHLFPDFPENAGIVPLVEAGFGFTILPGLNLESLTKGKQVACLPFSPPLSRTIGLLSHPYADLNDVTRYFLRLTKTYVSQWALDHTPDPG